MQTTLTPQDWKRLDAKARTAAKMAFFDQVITDPELTAIDLKVAWVLVSKYLSCDSGNSLAGAAWPSQETLAGDIGVSRSSAIRATRHLAERGWFTRHKARVSPACRNKQWVYSPAWERVAAVTPLKNETGSHNVSKESPFNPPKGSKPGQERVSPVPPESLLENPIKKTEGTRAGARAKRRAENKEAWKQKQTGVVAVDQELLTESETVVDRPPAWQGKVIDMPTESLTAGSVKTFPTPEMRRQAELVKAYARRGLTGLPSHWPPGVLPALLDAGLIELAVAKQFGYRPPVVSANDRDFEKFWQAYPSRRPHPHPRKPAKAKFLEMLEQGQSAAEIIWGAENYAAFVDQENLAPQYVQAATNWLKQETWRDYQVPPRKVQRDCGWL